MPEAPKAFLELLSACDAECQKLREALQLFSDAENPTAQDVTQATAFHNSLTSLRKLVQAVSASKH